MKKLLKAVIVILIFCFSAVQCVGVLKAECSYERLIYHIAGLDDASKNTDSLILLSYNGTDNSASVIQIPRDTYCRFGDTEGKINRFCASYVSSGLSIEESVQKASEVISNKFGMRLDGYFAITTSSLRRIIDSLGGVTVTLSEDFVIENSNGDVLLSLSKGENHLDGRESELFVRHRKSFITGDIGRMDNQKIFIEGLYRTVTKNASAFKLIKTALAVGDEIISDFSASDVLINICRGASGFRDISLTHLTLPGESIMDSSGVWYYILNRAACENVVEKHLYSDGVEFDKSLSFTNKDKPDFQKIYYKENLFWNEYNSNSVNDINIPRRKDNR